MTFSVDLIPEKFKLLPYYTDLVAAIEQLVSENVWDPIEQLKTIRQPRTMERIYLALTASLLGFKFNANLWDNLAYIRIVEGLAKYYEAKGTREFVDFMGWINNVQFELIPLWTKDYFHFYSTPGGPLAYTPGGQWFLSPHVALAYDATVAPAFPDVQALFYYMAPVNLVLEYILKFYDQTCNVRLLMSGYIKRVYE